MKAKRDAPARARGLFVTATGTDVGKTYASALIVSRLRKAGFDAGYYKAAISGIEVDEAGRIRSDASFVADFAGLDESHDQLVSYSYHAAVSPHLAARIEGDPVDLEVVRQDYAQAARRHDYVLVEGSGGIACPLRWDGDERILLEDVVRALGLDVLLVADAGLGTLNAIATTACYLRERDIACLGVMLNNFEAGNVMHEDNRAMVEQLSALPVIACIAPGETELQCDARLLASLFSHAGDGACFPQPQRGGSPSNERSYHGNLART